MATLGDEIFNDIRGVLIRLTSEEAKEHCLLLQQRLTVEEKKEWREETINLGYDRDKFPILGLRYSNPDPRKLSLAAYLLLQKIKEISQGEYL
ncbi:hypothetical protein HYT51_02595 [Candidatus Woesearchaeota archaeon]|nr:hypothetical protein [Candidatus Woesearchaeota archaeon]